MSEGTRAGFVDPTPCDPPPRTASWGGDLDPAADLDRCFCPDAGTCHHECEPDQCFRVHTCGPLSGVFPDDVWPECIVEGFRPGGVL